MFERDQLVILPFTLKAITMTMGDETPVTSLVLPVLIRPILSQVINYCTKKMYVIYYDRL